MVSKYVKMKNDLKKILIKYITTTERGNSEVNILVFLIVCLLVLFFYLLLDEAYNLYNEHPNLLMSLVALGLYLYPVLYNFYKEVKVKNKVIYKILKENDENDSKIKLKELDYYTFPQFMSYILKVFSSLVFFVCVQLLLMEYSENFSIESSEMIAVYLCIFYFSLVICLSFYLLLQGFCYSIKMFCVNGDEYTNEIWKDKDIILKKIKLLPNDHKRP